MRLGRTEIMVAALWTSLAAPGARAQFVNWTSSTTAHAGATHLVLTGLNPDGLSLADFDLTTTPYSAQPGTLAQQGLNFFCSDNWTATFDQPVSDLKLYLIYWRGDGGNNSLSPVRYSFNRPFTIGSGLSSTSISGTSITLPGDDLFEGVLQFSGSFQSLICVSNATLPNEQAMTFNVPEPSRTGSAVLILAMIALVTRRRCAPPRSVVSRVTPEIG